MIAYRFNEQNIFTGDTMEIRKGKGTPVGWTRTEPPEIPPGKFAKFSSGMWEIVDEVPPVFVPVPDRVTQRKARITLFRHDLLDLIESQIDAIEDEAERRIARIDWETASYISRNNPLVLSMADTLGISHQQLDDLFREAENVPD